MNITFDGPGPNFNFSGALGLAQRAHNSSLEIPGTDVFSHLSLDRASIAQELPSLAALPVPAPNYMAVPKWKVWQDF